MDNNYNGTGEQMQGGVPPIFYNRQSDEGGYCEPNKPKKEKKNSFGKTLGKTVAIALVFGLVAGSVFTGISYAGSKALGITNSAISQNVEEHDSEGPKVEASENKADKEKENTLQTTSTGSAKDLTDVSEIVDEVMPSIVAITNTSTVTYQGFFGQSQTYESESCGTGIIVAQNSDYIYIATNNHVVANAKSLAVTFCDDSVVEGVIQGTDASDDLAVVCVAISDIDEETYHKIKVATLGDSDALKVGEATIAIGNALGYGQSVTTGVVSALGRTVTVTDNSTGTAIVNNNLIQTDAAINPGNSGGALLNAAGEVIGINSVKYSETSVEGIGYAIPMNDAMEMINQLISTGSAYDTHTAYLGIQGKDMVDVSGNAAGVGVYSVMEGSGASKVDIRQNDIIIALDGKNIESMENLKEILTDYKAGDVVTLRILRRSIDGYEQHEVQVELSSASELNIAQ